jgi:hypothetical protein
MRIIGKKGIAFEKLVAVQSEAVLDEIIAHLEKLDKKK